MRLFVSFESRLPYNGLGDTAILAQPNISGDIQVMSLYDIFMLLILGGAIFLGMWKGLAWQVASIVSIALSYFVASNFWPVLAPRISVDPPLNEFIAMFVLFLGTALAVWIVFGVIRKTIESLALKSWDRQAGALAGALKGALLCMVITLFAVTLLSENNKRAIINSFSGRLITNAINRVAVAVPANMREKIDSYLKKYNDEVEKHYDPNESAAPLGNTLNELVESTLNKFNHKQGGQGAGTIPKSENGFVGSQIVTQPYNSNFTSNQGQEYVADVTTGDTSSGGLYFDVQTGNWIQATPQNGSGNFDWQETLNSARDQVTNTATEDLREAVRNRIDGNR